MATEVHWLEGSPELSTLPSSLASQEPEPPVEPIVAEEALDQAVRPRKGLPPLPDALVVTLSRFSLEGGDLRAHVGTVCMVVGILLTALTIVYAVGSHLPPASTELAAPPVQAQQAPPPQQSDRARPTVANAADSALAAAELVTPPMQSPVAAVEPALPESASPIEAPAPPALAPAPALRTALTLAVLRLREAPTTASNQLDLVAQNARVELLGPTAEQDGFEWLQVRLPDRTTGWVVSSGLE